MRFDEIDLIGDFKIQGLTGDSGKAIGFSGSNIEWIDAASGGTPANALSTSGYNYVIVEATGSAVENGNTLRGVMTNIASYINGTLTDQNRFTVLLMPGEYDMLYGELDNIYSSYVDIVGISSNPYDTVISRSDNGGVFRISSNDLGLYNLYFKNGYIYEYSAMTYMKWKNIVLGDGVFSGASGVTDMIGEFEDITILGACQFANVTNNIDGIFNNINYIGTGSSGFFFASGGSITGTFSNITSNVRKPTITTYIFYGGGGISGNFEKIDLYLSNQGCFYTSGNMTGTYRDIKLKSQSSDSFFFASDDANTVFEDIEIGETNSSNVFSINSGTFNGKYKNIKIGRAYSCFVTDTGFESTAKFENIQIESATGYVFSSTTAGNLNGTFKNITIGENRGCFFSGLENVYGTYKDITINGNVSGYIAEIQPDGCVFWAYNDFLISLENLTINGDVGGQVIFQYEDPGKGDFKLGGTFKNLKLGSVSGTLLGHRDTTAAIMGLIVDGLEFNQVNDLFPGRISILTASNINFNTIDSIMSGNGGSSIDFTNIKGNTINTGFQDIFVNNCVRNFEVKNVGPFFDNYYIEGISQSPLFKNIKINNGTSLFTGGNIASVIRPITGFFEDITIGTASNVFYVSAIEGSMYNFNIRNLNISNASNVFYVVDTGLPNAVNLFDNLLYNININECTGDFFYGNTNGFCQTLIENVFIGTASRIMKHSYGGGKQIIVKNLYAKAVYENAFPGSGVTTQTTSFKNSIIDMSDRDYGPSADESEFTGPAPTYQRCKLLALAGRRLSTTNSDYVIYSAFTKLNSDFMGGGALSLYNIQDPDVS